MSKELKIGLFAVTILTISFFLINYLRGEDLFNREIELSSRYSNVEGLVPSAPVFIKGYKAGKVAEVNYNAESEDFEVICSVKREFRIPSDSRMTIYSVDIMGGKGVKIELGKAASYAEDGDMLKSGFEAGLMDAVAGSVGPLLQKVNNTMDSLAVTVSGINALLSDKNRAHITNTLAHLERTMANVQSVSQDIEGRSAELVYFIENLSSLSAKLNSIADRMDTAISGVNEVVTTISESDLQGVISSLKILLDNMNDPDGTIGKLFVDNSVYDSVETLLNDIDTLICRIQENPKKYLRISVF